MLGAILLLLVGVGDIIRPLRSAPLRWIAIVAVWAAVAVAAVLGLGLAPIWVAAVIVLHAGWIAAVPADDRPRPRRLWPAIVLVVLVAADAVLDLAGAPSGPLAELYAGSAPADAGLGLPLAVGALGVLAFLTRSANLIVRAALGRSTAGEPAPPQPGGWDVVVGRRRLATVDKRRAVPAGASHLRGGRVIGPLERLLIVGLVLGGAPTVIAAIVAAKGIVRFPEISEDRGVGSKAEEFLVGSLTSWALAAGAAAFLWALTVR